MLKNIYSFLLLLLLLSSHSYAVVKNYITDEHPNNRYSVHNNGTVTDNNTGLMWKVCSQGQTWVDGSPDSCTGSTSTHNWQNALAQGTNETFASHSDWRLPNIKELRSLAAYNRFNPSINEVIFPSTPASNFWSASPGAGGSGYAWRLFFNFGGGNDGDRGDTNRVRLVRSGQ